jgi:hypothetical protein
MENHTARCAVVSAVILTQNVKNANLVATKMSSTLVSVLDVERTLVG